MGRQRNKRTHGRDTDERCTNTGIQPATQAVTGDALAHHVDGGGIHASLGGLHADLDEIEGVADDDGADATEAAGREGPQLRA